MPCGLKFRLAFGMGFTPHSWIGDFPIFGSEPSLLILTVMSLFTWNSNYSLQI